MGGISEVQDRITQSNRFASARGSESGSRFQDRTAARMARGLGWFSIGLGLAEVISPRFIGRITGARKNHKLIRMYGLREIAAGIGILSTARPAGWLWSRVAGDGMDLVSLSKIMRSRKRRQKALVGAAAVAGVTAMDVWCARRLSAKT